MRLGTRLTISLAVPLTVLTVVLELLEDRLSDQGITLRTTAAEPLPTVRADEDQLQEVLLNLDWHGDRHAKSTDWVARLSVNPAEPISVLRALAADNDYYVAF
jgi:light-regulated signal transduction histidine kinase (bacteriophytochrome)